MLVSSCNLSQSFNHTPYLFYKKRFKSVINSFCIWTLVNVTPTMQELLSISCKSSLLVSILGGLRVEFLPKENHRNFTI
jgi:hypothetical protein